MADGKKFFCLKEATGQFEMIDLPEGEINCPPGYRDILLNFQCRIAGVKKVTDAKELSGVKGLTGVKEITGEKDAPYICCYDYASRQYGNYYYLEKCPEGTENVNVSMQWKCKGALRHI